MEPMTQQNITNGAIETIEIYFLTVLEARSVRLTCWQVGNLFPRLTS